VSAQKLISRKYLYKEGFARICYGWLIITERPTYQPTSKRVYAYNSILRLILKDLFAPK